MSLIVFSLFLNELLNMYFKIFIVLIANMQITDRYNS